MAKTDPTRPPKAFHRRNIMTFDGLYARVAVIDEDGRLFREFSTTRAHAGNAVREDDGKRYPQVCRYANRRGATLTWHHDDARMAEDLADNLNARLLDPEAYEDARKTAKDEADYRDGLIMKARDAEA